MAICPGHAMRPRSQDSHGRRLPTPLRLNSLADVFDLVSGFSKQEREDSLNKLQVVGQPQNVGERKNRFGG